jgi:type II secretory pathway pseudopilin PulG
VEILVGISIMSIFMVIFTASMYGMFGTAARVQAVAETSNEASGAFMQLDREVRYASAISTPAFTTNAWHVEFLTTVTSRTSTTVTSSSQCTQLAVMPPAGTATYGVLEQRTWAVGDAHPSSWAPLTGGVTNYSSSSAPFPTTTSIAGGNASTDYQQLTVRLLVASKNSNYSPTTSTYTFTALNSSQSTTTSICQQFPIGSS